LVKKPLLLKNTEHVESSFLTLYPSCTSFPYSPDIQYYKSTASESDR